MNLMQKNNEITAYSSRKVEKNDLTKDKRVERIGKKEEKKRRPPNPLFKDNRLYFEIFQMRG